MSTLAKFIMAIIAILFIALATVVILKSQSPVEQPSISIPVDPMPIDPVPLEPEEIGTEEIMPPEAIPSTPLPSRRKLLPGNRLGGRLRRTPTP